MKAAAQRIQNPNINNDMRVDARDRSSACKSDAPFRRKLKRDWPPDAIGLPARAEVNGFELLESLDRMVSSWGDDEEGAD